VKFLAILKDSIKEALSGWLLQILMILAFLFMLLILSLSYRHIPAEDQVKQKFEIQNFLWQNNPEAGQPRFAVENFVQTNSGPYWRGNYKFDMVVTTPDEAAMNKAKAFAGRIPVKQELQINEIRKAVSFKTIDGEVKPSEPNVQRITYTTTDTNAEDGMSWKAAPKVFFFWEWGAVFWNSPRTMVYRIEKNLFGDFGMLAGLLISVIVTAGFIPNILRKGSLDLYVSKPVGRVQLLLMKYAGGLVYVVILATFTVTGVWLAVGIKSGVWAPGFLLMIPILTFYFALLYAFSTLIAVLTRNQLVAILLTCVAWSLVTGVGYIHELAEKANEDTKKSVIEVRKMQGDAGASEEDIKRAQPVPTWVEDGLFGARRMLPRTYDIDKLSGQMIAASVLSDSEYKEKYDSPLGVSWGEVIIISLLQIAVMLGLASWRMSTRDG
jgi:ABC-2 family transporter protein